MPIPVLRMAVVPIGATPICPELVISKIAKLLGFRRSLLLRKANEICTMTGITVAMAIAGGTRNCMR